METKTFAVLAILLIAASTGILWWNFNKEVIAATPSENIVMNLSELKVCCSYIDEQGKERSCIIQQRFDCSLCQERCTTARV